MAQLHITAEEIAAAITGGLYARMDTIAAELQFLNLNLFGANGSGESQPESMLGKIVAEQQYLQLQLFGYNSAGATQQFNLLGVLSFALYADIVDPITGINESQRSLSQIQAGIINVLGRQLENAFGDALPGTTLQGRLSDIQAKLGEIDNNTTPAP